jgi:DNA-binding NarL/FixJ family response regulator
MEKAIQVIIVDDSQLFRKGLSMQLKELKNIKVIAEAENGQIFLDMLKVKEPNLVFMDIKMPVLDGIEATKQAVALVPGIRIIALSMFGEEEQLDGMLNAGAKGFLTKNISKEDLEKAIRSVIAGNSYFADELLVLLTAKFVRPVTSKEQIPKISDRELEVLKLICKGETNAEMAGKLFLSQRTIDGHRASLISKVGAKNTVGLVTYAIKNKLINLE